jgi:uncharacterized protein
MIPGIFSLQIHGETLLLHPDRAVLWPRRRTVIVADTHFGKSGSLRRHGLAVAAGSDEQDRARLTNLMRGADAQRLVVLGDFVHAPLADTDYDALALQQWSESLRPATIEVIAGNHDRGATHAWKNSIRWLEGEKLDAPFRFIHDAQRTAAQTSDWFTLSGHVHPVIRLKGLRKINASVPAFWQWAHGIVLPSFGLFTGGHAIVRKEGERLYAIGSDRVVPIG